MLTYIPDEIYRDIQRLLLEKWPNGEPAYSYAQIAETVTTDKLRITPTAVGLIAHEMRLKRKPSRRKGTPGAGGRPTGPGKKFSPLREPAFKLFDEGKTPMEVMTELKLPNRQRAYQLHQDWMASKQSPPTDTEK